MNLRGMLLLVAIALVAFASGLALGPMILPDEWLGAVPRGAEEHAEDHDEHDHVALSRSAYDNLGLQVGQVTLDDYFDTIRVPGRIIEKPGHSDHAVAAPVNGVVSRVHAIPGQAVRFGEPLFDLEVTDESLSAAQLDLLDVLSRLEVVEAEIRRLAPLTESGSVAGRRKLELEYEQQQLEAKRQTRTQELRIRGLDEEQIASIIESKQLLRELTVRMPHEQEALPPAAGPQPAATGADDSARPNPLRLLDLEDDHLGDGWDFTIESLEVFPGKSVRRGEDLCHLAYHTVLFVEGEAFEKDVQAISQLDDRDWTVTVEFGSDGRSLVRDNLDVLYIDNHVEPRTQTYSFYVPLVNEVVDEKLDGRGKIFRSWRFRPGQRVHVVVPVKKYERQLKLPASAVVEEGAEAFVFRRHDDAHDSHLSGHVEHGHPLHKEDDHDHDHEGHDHEGHDHAHYDHDHDHGDEDHDHEEAFAEFDPVSVVVLHRDRDFIVVRSGDELRPGDEIALNNAYQLQMALKRARSGGGGGHHHDH